MRPSVRRLSSAGLACVLAVLPSSCGDAEVRHTGSLPNVVVLIMDTTRVDRCSVNGYQRSTTPRLEALAEECVVYRNAWSPSSWTGPAHASLFTGLRPEHHGFLRGVRDHLDEHAPTLAGRLAEHGYETACFSNNPNVGPMRGLDRGFEHFVPLFHVGATPLAALVPVGVGDDVPIPAVPVSSPSSAAETHRQALAWVRSTRQTGRPFFLFVNDLDVHLTYDPTSEAASAFLPADTRASVEAWCRSVRYPVTGAHAVGEIEIPEDRIAVLSALYDAEVSVLDAAVGDFVEALRDEGLLDDTLLVIASDHGENLGDHGLLDHVFSLHASLLRIPLLIRFPDGARGGTVVEQLVRLEDVPPTILEVCRAAPFLECDGKSLIHDLEGRIAYAALGPNRSQAGILRDYYPKADIRMALTSRRSVSDGRHHLIRSDGVGDELFDLLDDPGETRNLVAAGGPALARMRDLLERVYPRSPR